MARPEPRDAVQRLWSERYPSARFLFCAGSVVRGEGFASSDLDVVVLFDRVANAWRESLRFEGWPVEVFAHDHETLAYFVASDRERLRPALAQMLAEAIVVPEPSPLSDAIQRFARGAIAARPGAPTPASLAEQRYFLSDLLDDFRDDRGSAELRAVACELYLRVSRFVLQSRGEWLGSEKMLPRLVARADPESAAALEDAFDAFFTTGERALVVRAVRAALAPFGGEHFDGYRADAPAAHRARRAGIPWLAATAHDDAVRFGVDDGADEERLDALFAAAWPERARRDLAPVLARSLAYVCAFAGERLIGFVNVAWDGGAHAFLLDPTVHPDFQRRGIGTELVRRAAELARERGVEWLHVDYEPALAGFYRSSGFVDTAAGLLRLTKP